MAGLKRTLGRRSAMRLAGVAGGGLSAAYLLACGGGGQKGAKEVTLPAPAPVTTAAAQQAPVRDAKAGGTLRLTAVPNPAQYSHLDPHAWTQTTDFTNPIGNGLLKRSMFPPPKYQIVPDVAVSYEQPDELRYSFKLQQGVKFHNIAPVNGREMTSEDVKYSIERIATNDPKFFRKAEFAGAVVETPDKYTVILRTPKPAAGILDKLSTWGTYIFAKEYVEGVEGGLIKSTKPVPGTGPFIHDEFILDQSMKFKKNPDYWKKGFPYVDRIEHVPNTDTQKLVAAFKAKQLDIVDRLLHPQIVDIEKAVPDAKVLRQEGVQTQRVTFNLRQKPWDDVRVRKAVHLAINRQQIIQAGWYGVEAVMAGWGGLNQTVHGAAAFSRTELEQNPGYRKEKAEDLRTAKQLLTAAGITTLKLDMPFSIFGDNPQEPIHAQVVQTNLKEIGIEVNLVTKQYADTLAILAGNDWGIYDTRQQATGIDPDAFLDVYHTRTGSRNYGKWDNARFNDLFVQQGQTVDNQKRAAIVKDMIKLAEEEVPHAWTINWLVNVIHQQRVQNRGIAVVYPSEYEPEIIWLDG
ncbi:MAG: ABC transporter substrate-binding protein [Dehalococcoidia bacterium]